MDLNSWLVLIAAFGTAGFLTKLVLMLTGNDDGGLDGEDIDFGDDSDSTKSFLLLSTQTIFAALMVGGLAGLTSLNDGDAEFRVLGYTLLGAVVGGGLSAFMMRALRRLNSSSVKPIPKTGDVGKAYLPITADTGEVVLEIGGRQETFDKLNDWFQKYVTEFTVQEMISKEQLEYARDREGLLTHIKKAMFSKLGIGIMDSNLAAIVDSEYPTDEDEHPGLYRREMLIKKVRLLVLGTRE